MNELMGPYLYKGVIVYLDDIIVWADSLVKLEKLIGFVCEQMRGVCLMLNGKKSTFLTKELEVFGHWIKEGKLLP